MQIQKVRVDSIEWERDTQIDGAERWLRGRQGVRNENKRLQRSAEEAEIKADRQRPMKGWNDSVLRLTRTCFDPCYFGHVNFLTPRPHAWTVVAFEQDKWNLVCFKSCTVSISSVYYCFLILQSISGIQIRFLKNKQKKSIVTTMKCSSN